MRRLKSSDTMSYGRNGTQASSARPALEPLESRELLATCHVTRLSDIPTGESRVVGGDLRSCINRVNELPGPDVIDFQVTGTINLRGPLPEIVSDIDIQGPGSNLLTIRRDTGGGYRIFTVSAGTVAIRGVSITNGTSAVGGGIYSQADLTLEEVSVTSNKSSGGQGGGIYNTGTLLVTSSTISGNTSQGKFVGYGGGIYNTEFGQATISFSNVTANDATSGSVPASAYGGGIYNDGVLELFGVSVSSNLAHIEKNAGGANGPRAGYGGGIYNTVLGEMSIDSSTVTNNIARGEIQYLGLATAIGGGIFNEGTLDVNETTISGNQTDAKTGYGEADAYARGGGVHNTGTLTIRRSTLASNVSMSCIYDIGDSFSYGGGLNHDGGTATIIHSTISSNLATAVAAGALYGVLYAQGGGIFAGAPLTILHSTIVENTAFAEPPHGYGAGGGVSGNVTMRNSIVAGNTGGTSPDLQGTLVSSGYNLFSNSTGGGYAPTDLLNVNPMLGSLADNGGPTRTHALLPGSPAIDAGDNTDAPEWDQRGPGFPRMVNDTIDIGAFEVQSSPAPTPARFFAFLISADLNERIGGQTWYANPLLDSRFLTLLNSAS